MELDKKDRLILQALKRDARQSLSAIGKRIGLSQPAISERVRIDSLAAYGSVTTSLVLSHPISRGVPVR